MIKYTGNKNLANDHQRENLTSRYGDKFSELRNEFAIRCWQQRTLKRESLRETVGIGNHHNRRIFLGGGVTPRNILLWGVWKVGRGSVSAAPFSNPLPFF